MVVVDSSGSFQTLLKYIKFILIQGLTSRTLWVLMDFFKSKVDEAYSIGSEYISMHIDTYSNGIRNHPILQDSKVGLQGHSESW